MSGTLVPDLSNHFKKCRLCLEPFDEDQHRFVICPITWNQVHRLIGIELQVGEKFSNSICESCNATMDHWEDFKKRTAENQARIYKFEAEMKGKVRVPCNFDETPGDIVVKEERKFNSIEEVTKEQDTLADFKEEELNIKEEPTDQEQIYFCLKTFMGEDSSQVKDANTNIASVKKIVISPHKTFKPASIVQNNEKADKPRPRRNRPPTRYITSGEKRPSGSVKTRNRIYTQPYDCPYCEEFVTEDFDGHIEDHATHKVDYFCDICDYSTRLKPKLRNHVNWHTRASLRCAFCSSFFEYMRDRNTHETEAHLKVLDGGSTLCPCGASFKIRRELLNHLNKVHRGKFNNRRTKCRFGCEVSFDTVAEYEEHRRTEHVERPCEICGELFPPESLKFHHRKEHTIHKCPEEGCGQEFKKYSVFLSHRFRVHRHDPKQCSDCGVVFQNKLKLKAHINSVHKKRFACQIAGCDAKFHLILRMATHYYTGRKHKDLSTEERQKFVRELGLDPNVIEAKLCKAP